MDTSYPLFPQKLQLRPKNKTTKKKKKKSLIGGKKETSTPT